MTVINPSSISGITSITMPSGDGNVLTIHTNDGTERFRIDSSGNVKVGSACTISPDGDVFFTGVCTATTLTGAASGLTGALPAIDGSALTGMASTENVRTGILDVAGISTFRNDVNIGAAVTISESGIEASGIGITCANINGTQIGGRRNIVINGDMRIAQRASSSTSTGYRTVDRFSVDFSGLNESLTQAQVDVASGTTPYTSGFRKAFKITNGNQTGGAGNADYANIQYKFEAQDVSNSGWNYISSSSNITISFWVKSSVAQTFYAYLRTKDGTNYHYPISFALSADTWTKVTKTISGNSNLQIDNDNGEGMQFTFMLFYGTNYTSSSATLNAWNVTGSGDIYSPDNTTTWYTTNDATFEITGLQMEVGPQATPFEHRPYTEEFKLCQRYYQDWQDWTHPAHRGLDSSYDGHIIIDTLRIDMRANPTVTHTVYGRIADSGSWTDGSNGEAASLHNDPSSDYLGRYIKVTGAYNWDTSSNSTIAVKFVAATFDAEL